MTEEDLTEAKHFASLLLTDDELDELLEIERGSVMCALAANSPLGKAVRTGRLLAKCELHESILLTARRHSTPAQQMAAAMLLKIEAQ